MLPSPQTVQLIFIDVLFICLAAGIFFWFRSWLKGERRQIDRRLDALESHRESLERLGTRLLSASRSLEGILSERRSPDERLGDAVSPPQRGRVTTSAPAADWAQRLSELRRAAEATAGDAASRGGTASPSRARDSGPRSRASGAEVDRHSRNRAADSRGSETVARGKEQYGWARQLLEQGMSASEVARRVGLGLAEVEVLKRMNDYSDANP